MNKLLLIAGATAGLAVMSNPIVGLIFGLTFTLYFYTKGLTKFFHTNKTKL